MWKFIRTWGWGADSALVVAKHVNEFPSGADTEDRVSMQSVSECAEGLLLLIAARSRHVRQEVL